MCGGNKRLQYLDQIISQREQQVAKTNYVCVSRSKAFGIQISKISIYRG